MLLQKKNNNKNQAYFAEKISTKIMSITYIMNT